MKNILFILILGFGLFSCKTTNRPKNLINNANLYKTVKIFEQQTQGLLGPCEPSIFINPKNPNNIVAASVINYTHYSFDGGKTWTTNSIASKHGNWGDPCIVADNNGYFYYFHLSDPDGTNWKSDRILDRMVLQKSMNGGKSWTNGTGIGHHKSPKQQDKEWAIVNPNNNEIYLTWTEFDKYNSTDKNHHSRILFSKSTNNGYSWSKVIILSEIEGNAIDDNNTVEGATPAVGPNNEIYCAWSVNDKIYFDKSLDGGNTWLKKDIVATNQTGWGFKVPGMNRTNGMPVTCVDLSKSNYNGTIYINFADQRNGKNNTDVFIIKSNDKGLTWSKPIKVNQDNTKTHQFLTWMSVDSKTGFIYIVYYDRSKYNDLQTDVVLAVSKDGGKTFTNKTISKRPFKPNTNVFFGDYNNIHAYNGVVRPVWTSFENNKLSIWTCLIN